MHDSSEGRRILIIERQEKWREDAARSLREMGFLVGTLGHYDYNEPAAEIAGRPPDLVILGCARIKHEERELIHKILASELHLLVLCTSLPWGDMRAVFLAGADDVADKPYDPNRLVNIVKNAFESMKPRDSYDK